jgi:hypothetical protein
MKIWHLAAPAALAAALSLGDPAVAAEPADPCALLFVTPGYALSCTVQRRGGSWRVVVGPDDRAFGALSELSVAPVEEPIEDPRAWLRGQLRVDLGGLEDAVRDLTESDDSPFADEQFAAPIEAWLGMMTMLGDWPLQSCAEPVALGGTAGEDTELECKWQLGPFEQYLQTRLVERDGQHYVVRIRAMNPRRLRHLVAIANSL